MRTTKNTPTLTRDLTLTRDRADTIARLAIQRRDLPPAEDCAPYADGWSFFLADGRTLLVFLTADNQPGFEVKD